MQKVDREVALADIESWLNHKKVPEFDRQKRKDAIEKLVAAVEDGRLSYNEQDNTLTQVLLFPIEPPKNSDVAAVTELVYKPRLTQESINVRTKNISPTDLDGRIKAYAGALTGKADGILSKVSDVDLSIVESIATFFM